jgi:hypothetical protein
LREVEPFQEVKPFQEIEPAKSINEEPGKSSWSEHLKNTLLGVAALVSSIAIPLVGIYYTNMQKNEELKSALQRLGIEQAQKGKELGKNFIELGTKILSEKPAENTEPLRGWAIDLINHYGEVRIPSNVRDELLKYQLLPTTQSVAAAFELKDDFNIKENLDIYGHDIVLSGNSRPGVQSFGINSCAISCNGTPGCIAFSFDHASRLCYLKNDVGPTAILDPRSVIGVKKSLSLPKRSEKPKQVVKMPDRRITGQPINPVKTAPGVDQCSKLCESNEDCLAFTFLTEPGRSQNCEMFKNMYGDVIDGAAESGFRWQSPD